MARKLQTILTGDAELDKALSRFENNVRKKAIRRALRSTTKTVRVRAEANTQQFKTGTAKKFKVRAMKRSRVKIGAVVSTAGEFRREDDDIAFHGAFVELGTEDMDAMPYMRPALYDSEADIKRQFITELRNEIQAARK